MDRWQKAHQISLSGKSFRVGTLLAAIFTEKIINYYKSLELQNSSLRPAVAVVVEFTLSPVKGQPEGAKGKHVLGTPTPAGPFVPQRTPGLVPQSLSLVHPGIAVEGYIKLKTPS